MDWIPTAMLVAILIFRAIFWDRKVMKGVFKNGVGIDDVLLMLGFFVILILAFCYCLGS